jgi:hypothetical protein
MTWKACWSVFGPKLVAQSDTIFSGVVATDSNQELQERTRAWEINCNFTSMPDLVPLVSLEINDS